MKTFESNSFTRLIAAILPVAMLMLNLQISHAGSATWGLNPSSGHWENSVNWTPATVPNASTDTATFDSSSATSVSVSGNAPGVELNGIVFNAGASAFTITATPHPNAPPFSISGVGIVNNSGVTQNFVAGVDGSGSRYIWFLNSATAGILTTFTNNGNVATGPFPGLTVFSNTATAGAATFINYGSATLAGRTRFGDSSTAGNGTFINNGWTSSGGEGGITFFHDTAKPAAAILIANGGVGSGAGGRIALSFNAAAVGDPSNISQVKIFGNGSLDISDRIDVRALVGSLEGDGIVFLGSNSLAVGSNSRDTTFSGVIQGAPLSGPFGSLTKIEGV